MCIRDAWPVDCGKVEPHEAISVYLQMDILN